MVTSALVRTFVTNFENSMCLGLRVALRPRADVEGRPMAQSTVSITQSTTYSGRQVSDEHWGGVVGMKLTKDRS